MKLLFISDNFPPEINAPATRTFEHCLEWRKSGVEVTVITCFPNFPKGKVFKGYRNQLFKVEEIEGIRVIRIFSFIAANQGFIRRTLDFISFALMASLFGLFIKTDIVVTTSPQFFTNFSGLFLKSIKRIPWVMEVRDIWPESIRSVGALKNKIIYSLLESLELMFYRRANKIVVVTESFIRNISGRGVPKDKISLVFNGVNLSNFSNFETDKNSSEQMVLGYIGTHGMAHKLDFILDCAPELEENYPKLKLLFVGDGAEKKKLILKAKKMKLKNIEFKSPVQREKVPQIMSNIDFGLVNLAKSDTFKDVIPSKIFEISALGKPIYLGVEGEAKRIIETHNAGICFEPENRESFLNGIGNLLELKNKFDSKELDSTALAKKFDRKSTAMQMLSICKEQLNVDRNINV